MAAYYNEIDPYAAQWLRNLINAGHIAPGIVDERSIEDVYPSDLRGFTQCHFFAGIGVWSHALRSAGWSDDRPVWTGSCPCQPFSAAGKGTGFDDERHLWPAFHHLIKECQPAIVFGEQVASSDAGPWLDLVQDDLEALGHAFGAIPFPSAGVGAPHIRDRLYWVAYAPGAGPQGRGHPRSPRPGREGCSIERGGSHGGLAHLHSDGRDQAGQHFTEARSNGPVGDGAAGGMGDPNRKPTWRHAGSAHAAQASHGSQSSDSHGPRHAGGSLGAELPGPTNSLWRDADWLFCRDGRWRPVEPGTFPLAHGVAARVGRLRAYGNAINAEAARVFIEAVMECQP